MKDFIDNVKRITQDGSASLRVLFGDGCQLFKDSVGKLRFFSDVTHAECAEAELCDEKHYFLVPFKRADLGYTLYSTRVLPPGVPPVNDLPKRRFFHLPGLESKAVVEHMVVTELREYCRDNKSPGTGDILINLANGIDRVENKLSGGIILLGGLASILNPIAGAGIAASALIPKLGGSLSRYGLKWSGEALNDRQLKKEVEQAEKRIIEQFSSAETSYVDNTILRELQLALETTQEEHEPLNFDMRNQVFEGHDSARFSYLSCKAVLTNYHDLRRSKELWESAQLGPEDLAWLDSLERFVSAYGKAVNSSGMHRWRDLKSKLVILLKKYSEQELLDSIASIDRRIHYIIPYIAGRDILECDRYELERLIFSLLPELIENYLRVPEEYVKKLDEKGNTPHRDFKSKIILFEKELDKIANAVFENDARALRHLSLYLQERYNTLQY